MSTTKDASERAMSQPDEHVCTVSSTCTVARTRRAVGYVRRHWKRVRTAARPNATFCRMALATIRACDGDSTDLAQWPLGVCEDFKPLLMAVAETCPTAITTIRILDSAIEALSFGYWTGCDDCNASRMRTPSNRMSRL